MKVAIVSHGVCDESLLGGPGRVASRHAVALANRGNEVRVVTTDLVRKGERAPNPSFTLTNEGQGVVVECLAAYSVRVWPGAVGPLAIPRLSAVLGDAVSWADVVHAHEWPTPLTQTARRLCSTHLKPIFIQPHGTVVPRQGLKGALHRRYNAFHRVDPGDAFIVGSDEEAVHVRTVLEASSVIHKVINPSPTCSISEDAPEVVDVRTGWNFPPGATILLYGHRITPNKGLDLAISALAKLPSSYCLAVVGEDSTFPGFTRQCRELVEHLELGSRVGFFGPVDHERLEATILASDIFLLPARRDIFPLMVLHAMACGRPVVLTTACQCVESVGEVAHVANPDSASLAAAIASLTGDKTRSLGEAGKRLIESRYSPGAVAAQLEDLYRGRLKQSAPSPAPR